MYNKKVNIIEKIKELNFPPDQYVVVGSGILEALGIRKAADIDMAVTPKLFETLLATGEWETEEKYGKIFLKKDGFDISSKLSQPNYPTTTEEAIESALVIEGIPFMNLEELKRFKLSRGREKDKADIALIEKYQQENGGSAKI